MHRAFITVAMIWMLAISAGAQQLTSDPDGIFTYLDTSLTGYADVEKARIEFEKFTEGAIPLQVVTTYPYNPEGFGYFIATWKKFGTGIFIVLNPSNLPALYRNSIDIITSDDISISPEDKEMLIAKCMVPVMYGQPFMDFESMAQSNQKFLEDERVSQAVVQCIKGLKSIAKAASAPPSALANSDNTFTCITPAGEKIVLPSKVSGLSFFPIGNQSLDERIVPGTLAGFRMKGKTFQAKFEGDYFIGYAAGDESFQSPVSQPDNARYPTVIMGLIMNGFSLVSFEAREYDQGAATNTSQGLPFFKGTRALALTEETFSIRPFSERTRLIRQAPYAGNLTQQSLANLMVRSPRNGSPGQVHHLPWQKLLQLSVNHEKPFMAFRNFLPRYLINSDWSQVSLEALNDKNMLNLEEMHRGLEELRKQQTEGRRYDFSVTMIKAFQSFLSTRENVIQEFIANIGPQMSSADLQYGLSKLLPADLEKLTAEQRLMIISLLVMDTQVRLDDLVSKVLASTPAEQADDMIAGLKGPSRVEPQIQSLVERLQNFFYASDSEETIKAVVRLAHLSREFKTLVKNLSPQKQTDYTLVVFNPSMIGSFKDAAILLGNTGADIYNTSLFPVREFSVDEVAFRDDGSIGVTFAMWRGNLAKDKINGARVFNPFDPIYVVNASSLVIVDEVAPEGFVVPACALHYLMKEINSQNTWDAVDLGLSGVSVISGAAEYRAGLAVTRRIVILIDIAVSSANIVADVSHVDENATTKSVLAALNGVNALINLPRMLGKGNTTPLEQIEKVLLERQSEMTLKNCMPLVESITAVEGQASKLAELEKLGELQKAQIHLWLVYLRKAATQMQDQNAVSKIEKAEKILYSMRSTVVVKLAKIPGLASVIERSKTFQWLVKLEEKGKLVVRQYYNRYYVFFKETVNGAADVKIGEILEGKLHADPPGDKLRNYAAGDVKEYSDDLSFVQAGKETGPQAAGIVCREGTCGIVGGACFVAGTLVHTERGLLPIEQIKAGERVFSYDETTRQTSLQKVRQTFTRGYHKLVRLFVPGDTITATDNHPFYADNAWQIAASLQKGMRVLLYAGTLLTIDSVSTVEQLTTVYNLEVDLHHNYFVGKGGVLVHNGAPYDPKGIPSGPGTYEVKPVIPSAAAEDIESGLVDLFLKTDAERAPYVVSLNGGQLFAADGNTLNGRYMFVMDKDGRFFARLNDPDNDADIFVHAAFLNGEPVACAGEFYASNGKITWLSNASGHYRPEPRLLSQSIDALQKAGYRTSNIEVRLIPPNLKKDFQISINDKLLLEIAKAERDGKSISSLLILLDENDDALSLAKLYPEIFPIIDAVWTSFLQLPVGKSNGALFFDGARLSRMFSRIPREKFADLVNTVQKADNQTEALCQWLASQNPNLRGATRGRFDLKAMPEGTADADKKVKMIDLADNRFQFEVYLNKEKNQLVWLDGEPLGMANDEHMYNYVMDETGRIFAMSGDFMAGSTKERYAHSSFLGGRPVAGAGSFFVTQGQAEMVSNTSGHYLPQGKHLVQVLSELNERGFLPGNMLIMLQFSMLPDQLGPMITLKLPVFWKVMDSRYAAQFFPTLSLLKDIGYALDLVNDYPDLYPVIGLLWGKVPDLRSAVARIPKERLPYMVNEAFNNPSRAVEIFLGGMGKGASGNQYAHQKTMLTEFNGEQIPFLKTAQERAPFEVRFVDGKLTDRFGVPLSGRFLYAMDAQGNLYVKDMIQAAKEQFHHSSFFHQQPIASGGHITLQNGAITELSNQSGHYQPGPEHLYQLFQELKARGYIHKNEPKITLYFPDNNRAYSMDVSELLLLKIIDLSPESRGRILLFLHDSPYLRIKLRSSPSLLPIIDIMGPYVKRFNKLPELTPQELQLLADLYQDAANRGKKICSWFARRNNLEPASAHTYSVRSAATSFDQADNLGDEKHLQELFVNKATGKLCYFDGSTVEGNFRYVMTLEGRIYVLHQTDMTSGGIVIPNIIDGGDAASAGSMVIEFGKIKSVNNALVDYRITPEYFFQLFEELNRRGFATTDATITLAHQPAGAAAALQLNVKPAVLQEMQTLAGLSGFNDHMIAFLASQPDALALVNDFPRIYPVIEVLWNSPTFADKSVLRTLLQNTPADRLDDFVKRIVSSSSEQEIKRLTVQVATTKIFTPLELQQIDAWLSKTSITYKNLSGDAARAEVLSDLVYKCFNYKIKRVFVDGQGRLLVKSERDVFAIHANRTGTYDIYHYPSYYKTDAPLSSNQLAPDYRSTPHLFPVSGTQQNIVRIRMTGTRAGDNAAASQAAGLANTTLVDASGNAYTWHHLDDFDPSTGECTMQLVKKSEHDKSRPHSGAVSQYEKYFNTLYQ